MYALVTLYCVLSYFSSPMKVLQGISQDLYSGMKLIQDCQRELVVIRTSDKELQEISERIYSHSCRLAAKSDITPGQRQSHRSKFQSSDPKEYYKVTVLLPFIDHIIADIESRFTKHTQKVARLQGLLPTSLTQESSFADINEAVLFYKTDLLNADIVDEEFCRWKRKWVGVPLPQRPQNLQDCLAPVVCPLPNIRTLLQLFATLPLSTCLCERSGSALRRLNTYLRST